MHKNVLVTAAPHCASFLNNRINHIEQNIKQYKQDMTVHHCGIINMSFRCSLWPQNTRRWSFSNPSPLRNSSPGTCLSWMQVTWLTHTPSLTKGAYKLPYFVQCCFWLGILMGYIFVCLCICMTLTCLLYFECRHMHHLSKVYDTMFLSVRYSMRNGES